MPTNLQLCCRHRILEKLRALGFRVYYTSHLCQGSRLRCKPVKATWSLKAPSSAPCSMAPRASTANGSFRQFRGPYSIVPQIVGSLSQQIGRFSVVQQLAASKVRQHLTSPYHKLHRNSSRLEIQCLDDSFPTDLQLPGRVAPKCLAKLAGERHILTAEHAQSWQGWLFRFHIHTLNAATGIKDNLWAK